MKRIIGIAMVLGLMGAVTVMVGCSKAKEEPPTEKVEIKKIDKEGETAAKEVKPGKVVVIDLGKDVPLEMVLIPAGKFEMGSSSRIVERQHEVTLTKSYYMGKYEVTQEQYEAVMGKNPSENKGRMLPVNRVSWKDCQEFIKKLNDKTKGGYRLPTEAEWEYACRAGTTTAYSFGDKITPKDANYNDSRIGKPVAVGSYKPNAFGLYDMHGNVWEWCDDWYGDYPKGAVTDPKAAAINSSLSRVLRGGSFGNIESAARSSYRYSGTTSNTLNGDGFRLAKTP